MVWSGETVRIKRQCSSEDGAGLAMGTGGTGTHWTVLTNNHSVVVLLSVCTRLPSLWNSLDRGGKLWPRDGQATQLERCSGTLRVIFRTALQTCI